MADNESGSRRGSDSRSPGGTRRVRKPPPPLQQAFIGDLSNEPSSPQADQLFRVKRGASPTFVGGDAGGGNSGGASAGEEEEAEIQAAHQPDYGSSGREWPARQGAPVNEAAQQLHRGRSGNLASEAVTAESQEPSSPQAAQLVRIKRSSSGAISAPNSSTQNSPAQGERMNKHQPPAANTARQEPDSPSSPQAEHMIRIRREKANSQSTSPASNHAAKEDLLADLHNGEPSSPQAAQLIRIRRQQATSRTSSPATQAAEAEEAAGNSARQANAVQANAAPHGLQQDELDQYASSQSPTNQEAWDNEVSSPQARSMLRKKRHSGSGLAGGASRPHSSSREPPPVRGEDGFGQQELDDMARPYQPPHGEESWQPDEPSSPQARRMFQAKRQQALRQGEAAQRAQASPDPSISSGGGVDEAQEHSLRNNAAEQASAEAEDECYSPQASQMRRVKQMRQQGGWAGDAGASAGGAFRPPPRHDASAPHASEPQAALHHWQGPRGGPGAGAGGAGAGQQQGQGIRQEELDALCLEGPESPWGNEPSSPQASQLFSVKRVSRTPSPRSGPDTSDGELRYGASGSTSSTQSSRYPQAGGASQQQAPQSIPGGLTQQELDACIRSDGPPAQASLRQGEGGLGQEELDSIALSAEITPGEQIWNHQEPSSPQAAQLRRRRQEAQRTNPGQVAHGQGERLPEAGTMPDSLANARPAQPPPSSEEPFFGEEPSSPQAAQMRRVKHMSQQSSGRESPDRVEDRLVDSRFSPPEGGISQAQLDAVSRSLRQPAPEGEEWAESGEPSSPQSRHMLNVKRRQQREGSQSAPNSHATSPSQHSQGVPVQMPSRTGGRPQATPAWDQHLLQQEAQGLNQEELDALGIANEPSPASSSGRNREAWLPVSNQRPQGPSAGLEHSREGAASPFFPEQSGGDSDAEEARWQAAEMERRAQREVRAMQTASSRRYSPGPSADVAPREPGSPLSQALHARHSQANAMFPGGAVNSAASAADSWHYGYGVGPPAREASYRAPAPASGGHRGVSGLTQAELDALTNGIPEWSPPHRAMPVEVDHDLDRNRSGSSSETPPRPAYHGLTQAELNALSQESSFANALLPDAAEPASPQANRMQSRKKAARFTGNGVAPSVLPPSMGNVSDRWHDASGVAAAYRQY